MGWGTPESPGDSALLLLLFNGPTGLFIALGAAAGVACRWLVPGVSFGRGLLTGLVVGFAGVVLRVFSLLEDIIVLLVAEAVLVATFLACKRGVDHSRKKQTDQSQDMSQQPW